MPAASPDASSPSPAFVIETEDGLVMPLPAHRDRRALHRDLACYVAGCLICAASAALLAWPLAVAMVARVLSI